MASFWQSLGTAVFSCLFLFFVTLDVLACKLILLLRRCGVLSRTTAETAALVCTKLTWTCAVRGAFWIRTVQTTPGAWAALCADMRASDAAAKAGGARQPLFLLSNHVSFFDSVEIPVVLPLRLFVRTRVYMASYLLKVPLLGTVSRAMGHFPVHFAKDEVGCFKVDHERMVAVEEAVDAHLASGGVLTLFPEGQLNRGPRAPFGTAPSSARWPWTPSSGTSCRAATSACGPSGKASPASPPPRASPCTR